MSKIDQIINDVTCKEVERRAKWIDLQIFQLLTPFQNYVIRSSSFSKFFKDAAMRVSGVTVEIHNHVADFGHTVIIKQHGVVKASRIYS